MALNITMKKKTPPPKEVVKEAVATTTVENSDGSESSEQEVLGSMAVDPMDHCMVELSVGMTRNLGDYNSMRFNVGITLPSKTTEDELNEAFASAKQWIDDKVSALNAEIDTLIG